MTTGFEDQIKQFNMLCGMVPSWIERGPSATEMVMVALGYDPTQDGLYICQKCGVTHDPECDYGGWHGKERLATVAVPWMAQETEPGHASD